MPTPPSTRAPRRRRGAAYEMQPERPVAPSGGGVLGPEDLRLSAPLQGIASSRPPLTPASVAMTDTSRCALRRSSGGRSDVSWRTAPRCQTRTCTGWAPRGTGDLMTYTRRGPACEAPGVLYDTGRGPRGQMMASRRYQGAVASQRGWRRLGRAARPRRTVTPSWYASKRAHGRASSPTTQGDNHQPVIKPRTPRRLTRFDRCSRRPGDPRSPN
jgi:hypothetical protein